MNVFANLLPRAALIGGCAFGVLALQDVALAQTEGAIQMNLVEHAITDIPADIGEPGPSLGDLLTFVNLIFDENETAQIGDDRGFCSLVEVGVSYYCTFAISLPEGTITTAGSFYIDGRPSSTFVVTGGTGLYNNAGGQITFTFRDSDAGFPKYTMAVELVQ